MGCRKLAYYQTTEAPLKVVQGASETNEKSPQGFTSTDPMMQFSSPYNGMGNDPVNLIDPTGMRAVDRERDLQNRYADPTVWGAGLTPDTYGGSFYGSRYGVSTGSYGSDYHQEYTSYRDQVRVAKKGGKVLGGSFDPGSGTLYTTRGNAYYSNAGNMAGGIEVIERTISLQANGGMQTDPLMDQLNAHLDQYQKDHDTRRHQQK